MKSDETFEAFGDRVKALEMIEGSKKFLPRLPLIARLDGRAFHSFCKGAERPYDKVFGTRMIETTRQLVDEFHVTVGYTQSDEITLIWKQPDLFDNRIQKLVSVLAGYCSSVFSRLTMVDEIATGKKARQKGFPCFDCRVWQVPSLEDALEVLIWREADSVKNSTSMAAQSLYSHKELQGKSRPEQLDMLLAKGILWQDYPPHQKRGVYLRRQLFQESLTLEQLAKIPEKNRPESNLFIRSRVVVLDLEPIQKLENPIKILFEEPSRDSIESVRTRKD